MNKVPTATFVKDFASGLFDRTMTLYKIYPAVKNRYSHILVFDCNKDMMFPYTGKPTTIAVPASPSGAIKSFKRLATLHEKNQHATILERLGYKVLSPYD